MEPPKPCGVPAGYPKLELSETGVTPHFIIQNDLLTMGKAMENQWFGVLMF